MNRIRLEEIYDAATDDSLFQDLAARFAQMIGARSGVIHWRPADDADAVHEVSHTNYFSQNDMAAFDRNFAGQDLWSNAVQAPEAVNRIWDCEALVPRKTYEDSILYNEWIRAIGDDSFFAVGGALRTSSVVAELGFHRGRDQGGFAPEAAAMLNEYAGHLTRCLSIREQIKRAEAHEQAATAALDVLGYAIFTLSTSGRILHHNAAAETLLERGDPFKVMGSKLCATEARDRGLFADAVEGVSLGTAPPTIALTVASSNGGSYDVSLLSAQTQGGRTVMVVVKDPGARDTSLVDRLRTRYGLSLAEAEVAVRLADGVSVRTLSDERQTALETVRSQVKAVASKLRCSRQPEIVALVRSFPPLAPRS